ncbi:HNH endonuclease [Paenibacillus taichungensis]|uniref:HNH endonuclease n=1 Tax=Paenibacillus taichungensis TaxID=484184 RepID=UPI0039A3EE4F
MRTTEEIIKKLSAHSFKILEANFTYKGNKEKFLIECKNGHDLFTSFNALSKRYACKVCDNHIEKYEYLEVFEEFKKNGCELLSETYSNNKQKLSYRCSCGNVSKITFYQFKSGVRCRKCSGSQKYTYDEVQDLFRSQGCELVSNNYQSNKQKLDYICSCGNRSLIQLSNFLNGVRCMNCYRENNKKENHPAWNPLLTDEERIAKRKFSEYKYWRSTVFKRDKYTCQACGDDKGGNLNAHHLNGWHWAIDERVAVHNGVTLCNVCHDDFHYFYGYGDNTKEQFIEWINKIHSKTVSKL